VSNLFFKAFWPGAVVWSVLYISDYFLTLTCARLYQAGASEKIVFEGSFELTPFFQKDIDSLRKISPRFLILLVLSNCYLLLVWWLVGVSQNELYQFALGYMILLQLMVHIRHLRNLFLFRAMSRTDGVRGRIEYPRPLLLRMSAFECLTFSGLYFVLFAIVQSYFLLGGTIACLLLAAKHRKIAYKSKLRPDSSVPGGEGASAEASTKLTETSR
jgi:hypothetical protein